MKDLNVDYIDLMLIHQPGYDDEGVYEAMEDAVRAGECYILNGHFSHEKASKEFDYEPRDIVESIRASLP